MYHIDPPNCWVSYCWQVGCIKREENDIQKPCIHKVAGSGINEMIFPTFGGNQVLTNSVQVHTGMPIYSCVHQKIIKLVHLCAPHWISLFVNWVSLVFLVFLQHTAIVVLFCQMFFTLGTKKSFTLPCIRLRVTGLLFRGVYRTLWTGQVNFISDIRTYIHKKYNFL